MRHMILGALMLGLFAGCQAGPECREVTPGDPLLAVCEPEQVATCLTPEGDDTGRSPFCQVNGGVECPDDLSPACVDR